MSKNNKGNINTRNTAFKMSDESCHLYAPEETELKKMISQPSDQIELLESEVKSLKAELQQLHEKMDTEKQITKEKTENSFETMSKEMDQLESLLEKTQAESAQLSTLLNDLKEENRILNENIQSMKDEKDENQGQIHSLKTEVLALRCRVKDALDIRRDRDEIQQRLAHVEFLLEKKQVEGRKQTETFQRIKENEELLYERNDEMSDEVARLESLVSRTFEDNQNLKKTVQDLQCQLEEDRILKWKHEELLRKQDSIIAHQQQDNDEGNNIKTALKEKIQDLKDQLERRQEEEILAGVENIGAELRLQAENIPEEQKGEVIIEIPKEQPPAPRTQRKGFLSRCAGGLLKAGLAVGIATAGAITLGYLVSGLDNTDDMYSLTAYAKEMIEPYCDRSYITPPPF